MSWKNAGLESEDLGIFDNRCVIIWENDKHMRRVVGGRVLWEKSDVPNYLKYFHQLLVSAISMSIVTLRRMTPEDRTEILQWPSYQGRNAEYNYGIKEGGWIDYAEGIPNSRKFAAISADRLIGFSLLVPVGQEECEFFVALHPNLLGEGFGYAITLATLREGFENQRLGKISLRLRSWNKKARRVYEAVGFIKDPDKGHAVEEIDGQDVAMTFMVMTPHQKLTVSQKTRPAKI